MAHNLTHTERRVLDIIRTGGNYADITSRLALSRVLARKIVGQVAEKTGVKTWEELKKVTL